jgi:hypothetical protein
VAGTAYAALQPPQSLALYAKVIMKRTYQILLFLTLSSVILSAFYYLDLMPKMDSASGNAGAFAAALFIAFGALGLLVITVIGTVTFSIAFVFQDKLPSHKIYHWGVPLAFCIPGYGVCLFIIYSWLAVGI